MYCVVLFVFLMIRRPPRSTLDRSSAASDVYKRQVDAGAGRIHHLALQHRRGAHADLDDLKPALNIALGIRDGLAMLAADPVSYTHLRAHETVLDLVCRLLLEKKKNTTREAKEQTS